MKTFRCALKLCAPVLTSYLFIGIAAGVLLRNSGYGIIWSFLSALFIYAGSLQIVLVGLLSAGSPIISIGLMALFVNARHIFYGIAFIDDYKIIASRPHSRWKHPYMVLTLTDEAYSLLCDLNCPEGVDKYDCEFYIQLICHLFWVFSCTLGAALGQALPFDLSGIDFAATALFISVVVNQWREQANHLPALLGAGSALIALLIFKADNFLLPALGLSLAMLTLCRDIVAARSRGASNE